MSLRNALALAVLLVFPVGMSAPSPAASSGFTQAWSVAGWTLGEDIGNADGDPQHELMFINNADGHFAIFDALTGAIQQEFTFQTDNTQFVHFDIDGDGRRELFFSRPAPTPLFTAYRWNGSSFAPIFTHADTTETLSFAHLRNSTSYDILEVGGTDVRVRNTSGAVIFRASIAIPGWSGQPTLWATPVDIDHDGDSEILINDHQTTRLIAYAGSFTQTWAASGWYFAAGVQNLDGDPQSELIAGAVAGGRWAVLDGLTGAVQKEFPEFTMFTSGYQPADLDGNGLSHLFFTIQPGLGEPLFSAYHWNGSSIAPLFSHTDPILYWSWAHLRNSTQFDILEQSPDDVRVRDMSGTVLFRGSSDVAGWSGQDPFYSTAVDLDHDGVAETLINDHDKVRLVKYAGGFTQPWIANGWQIGEVLGNTDGDAQDEILLAQVADEHYGLFDGLTGVLEKDLPDFAIGRSGYTSADVDADGPLELFMYRYLLPGQSPLLRAHHWNGSSYATMFSHTDSLLGADIRHLRSSGLSEVLEAGPSDVRLRDMNGAVIFRASTDVSGWAGLDPNSGTSISSIDFDVDGLQELVVTDLARVRFINHDGTTSVPESPSGTGFHVFANTPNPFHSSTAFRISTPREGEVRVRIFDTGGRLVRMLDQRLPAGIHQIDWDGRDHVGRNAPSGVLFYEVSVAGSKQTRKVIRVQ